MESPGTSFSLSSLMCDEDGASFLHSDDQNTGIDSLNPCFISEYEEEYIENLFTRELRFLSSNDCSSTGRVRLKGTRLDAIEWIFNTRKKFGLIFQTAYLSVTYFDRFFSKRSIDEDNPFVIQLLSVACLSLAAKMEEQKPPLLYKYMIDEEHCITNESIKKMELAVLSTLEWKMGTVTPFAYLHYFVSMFCPESRPEGIVSEAEEHIVAIVKDVNLMDQRPSVIALAATLMAAFDATLTRKDMDLHISAISRWGNLESLSLFISCYNLMQEKEKERKLNTPALDLLSNHSSSTYVLDNSSVTFKRTLTFEDIENCPERKQHRT